MGPELIASTCECLLLMLLLLYYLCVCVCVCVKGEREYCARKRYPSNRSLRLALFTFMRSDVMAGTWEVYSMYLCTIRIYLYNSIGLRFTVCMCVCVLLYY
jgi:hypothetical protein